MIGIILESCIIPSENSSLCTSRLIWVYVSSKENYTSLK